MLLFLAHQAAGASWQALVTVVGVLSAALFLLVVARAVRVSSHSDLVLPLAGVVIISSMGTAQSDTLSDHVGWALPLGVVALLALIAYAFWPAAMRPTSPATITVVIVAILAGVLLEGPVSKALHPPVAVFDVQSLPFVDDVAMTIVSPATQSTVTSPVTIVLEVTGGTVGNRLMTPSEAPSDPEQLGLVRILDGTTDLLVLPLEPCTPQDPCTTLTYELDLAPGTHTLYPEFLTATGSTFRTSVFASLVLHVR